MYTKHGLLLLIMSDGNKCIWIFILSKYKTNVISAMSLEVSKDWHDFHEYTDDMHKIQLLRTIQITAPNAMNFFKGYAWCQAKSVWWRKTQIGRVIQAEHFSCKGQDFDIFFSCKL